MQFNCLLYYSPVYSKTAYAMFNNHLLKYTFDLVLLTTLLVVRALSGGSIYQLEFKKPFGLELVGRHGGFGPSWSDTLDIFEALEYLDTESGDPVPLRELGDRGIFKLFKLILCN